MPLELRPTDAWEVEHGYVIPAEDYGLEDPGFTDEERAALWLAAQVVRLGGRPTGPEGLLKLGGAPVPPAGEPLAADLGAGVDDLAVAFRAIADRRTLEFTTGDVPGRSTAGADPPARHWYLMAVEKGQERCSGWTVGVDTRPVKRKTLSYGQPGSTPSPPFPRCLGRQGPTARDGRRPLRPRRRLVGGAPATRGSSPPARGRVDGGDPRCGQPGFTGRLADHLRRLGRDRLPHLPSGIASWHW